MFTALPTFEAEAYTLSSHFDSSEFVCDCGCGAETNISPELINRLEELFDLLNCSYAIITSGYRHYSTDRHHEGIAADVIFYDQSGTHINSKIVCCIASDLGINGVANINSNYQAVHIDVRTNNRYWGDEIYGYNSIWYQPGADGQTHTDFYEYFQLSREEVYDHVVSKSSSITITNPRYPEGDLPHGQIFSIAGVISSNYQLSTVWGGVFYDDYSPTSEYLEMNPNTTTFSIYDHMDWDIHFDSLTPGHYRYIIKASDVTGYTQTVIESEFSIYDDSPSSITISNVKYPDNLKLGNAFSISGEISSHHALTRIYGGVYTENGEPTAQYLDVSTNGNYYDLATEFDSAIRFNDLAEGSYIYKIYATDIKHYTQLLIERSFTVTRPEPVYHGEYAKAIDISEFQGDINWTIVAESGIEYVIIRAGSTYYEDASVFMTDEKFQYNYNHAKAAGLKIGVYAYTSAVSSKEMTANINSLLSIIQGCKLDLPVFLDVEQSNRQIAIGNKALTSLLLVGCNQIRNAGFKPGVYANEDWFSHYVDASVLRKNEILIWKAAWVNDDPLNYDHSGSCSIFQHSDCGSIPGISGHVDLDLIYNPSTFATKADDEEVAPQYQLGDVNCDGMVDVSDAVMLSRFCAEDTTVNIKASGKAVADANEDGKIDLDDTIYILQIIAKMI